MQNIEHLFSAHKPIRFALCPSQHTPPCWVKHNINVCSYNQTNIREAERMWEKKDILVDLTYMYMLLNTF